MKTSSIWTVTENYRNSDAGNAFSSMDKVFSLAGQRVSNDKISYVHRVIIAGSGYYVKRYTRAGKGLRRYVGRSRIRAEWENIFLFHDLGLSAVNVVAYGEEKRFGIMIRGAMVTEEVKNAFDLKAMADKKSPALKNRKWMDSVIQQVAHIARTLHKIGFIHVDFKWRNILVTQEPNPKVTLFDCPSGGKTFPFLKKRGRVKDLACLDKVAKYHLTRTQRLKFYTLYTGHPLRPGDKLRIKKIRRFFKGRE